MSLLALLLLPSWWLAAWGFGFSVHGEQILTYSFLKYHVETCCAGWRQRWLLPWFVLL